MASRQKMSDIGWMYHTPNKADSDKSAVAAPPASQIPGLSDLPHEPEPELPVRKWIKDTDTDYIRLCKEGGRPNLLAIRDPKEKSKEAKPYPKCEWFYLSDNVLQDEAESLQASPHTAMLPDYMVHDDYRPHGDFSLEEKRPPYAYDKISVFDREKKEGRSATDKTVKIEELKKLGYGVRSDKLQNKQVKISKIVKTEKVKPHEGELHTQSKQNYPPVPAPHEEDQTIIAKLLSDGYRRDWEDQRGEWYKKSVKLQQKSAQHAHARTVEKNTTEYQAMIAPSAAAEESTQQAQPKKDESSEPFKLSRFKNVPARVESHRPLAAQAQLTNTG